MNAMRLAIGLLLCCSLPAIAAEKVKLPVTGEEVEFKFTSEPGETALIQVVTRTVGSMNMFGSTVAQKFSQEFEQEMATKCLEVRPDGNSVHEISIPNVAMRMNMGGFKMAIDTRKETPSESNIPGLQPVERMFEAMTRIRCQVTISPQGETLKVEGLSAGMKQILDDLGNEIGFGMKQFFDQFSEFLQDDMLAEQMRSSWRVFPEGGKGRVGDNWTREWEMKLPPFGKMQGQGEYEIVGFEYFRGRPCAKIRAKTTLTTSPGQKPDPAALGNVPRSILERMEFSMTSTGGNGLAYIDFTNGDLLFYRETQRMAIEMSMAPDPQAAEEELKGGLGKITQNLTTATTVELIEKNGEGLYDDDVEEGEASQTEAASAPAGSENQ